MLCILAHMHKLGYNDGTFYNSCIKYLTLKIKAGVTADEYCPHTVNVVRNALHSHGVQFNDTLVTFFDNVGENDANNNNNDNNEERRSVNEFFMPPEV